MIAIVAHETKSKDIDVQEIVDREYFHKWATERLDVVLSGNTILGQCHESYERSLT